MTTNATPDNLAKLARLIAIRQPLNEDAVSEAIDLCVAAWRASEQARQRAEKKQAACEKALFDAIEEGGCPMYEVQMEEAKGMAWPVAAYERIENLHPAALAPDAPPTAEPKPEVPGGLA